MPRLRAILRGVGHLIDEGDWLLDEQVLACAYPRTAKAI